MVDKDKDISLSYPFTSLPCEGGHRLIGTAEIIGIASNLWPLKTTDEHDGVLQFTLV